MSKNKVTIIILNWNSSDDTISLLNILSKQTCQNFQVIIIDNHSTDDSVNKLSAYGGSNILIRNKKNLGYAGGNNVGIDVAIHNQADYVWILNPDVRPTPEALSILLESMENDSSLAAIGPRIFYHEKPSVIYSDGGFIFPEKGFLVVHKNHNKNLSEISENKTNEVDYINGSAILMRIKTLQDIGKFREDFFLYYEETEWCLRAKKHGWNIVSSNEAVVFHKSSKKGFRYHFFMARNRILLSKVCDQYRLQSFKVELIQLRRFIKKPLFINMLFFVTRIIGIFCGLVISPRETIRLKAASSKSPLF